VVNLLNPLLAGQDLSPTFFNATIDNARSMRYKTTEPTRNNTTTYLDSTDLVMPVAANAAYILDSCLFYDTSAAADIKIRMSLPPGSTALIAPWSSGTGITTNTNSINQQGSAPISNVIEWIAGGVASGTVMSIRPTGWINVAGTAGNLVIGHTQNTATAVDTLLKLGSWFAISRVF
jgi:hypothetical protein